MLTGGDVRFAVTPLPTGPVPSLTHNAPRRQLVLWLTGTLAFTMVDDPCNVTTLVKTGDVMLAEDLFGPGHRWKFVANATGDLQPFTRAYVHLNDTAFAQLRAAMKPVRATCPASALCC